MKYAFTGEHDPTMAGLRTCKEKGSIGKIITERHMQHLHDW